MWHIQIGRPGSRAPMAYNPQPTQADALRVAYKALTEIHGADLSGPLTLDVFRWWRNAPPGDPNGPTPAQYGDTLGIHVLILAVPDSHARRGVPPQQVRLIQCELWNDEERY